MPLPGAWFSRRRLSIRALVSLVILAMMLVLAVVLMWHGGRSTERLLVNAMQESVSQLAARTETHAHRLIDPARRLLTLLSHDALVEAEGLDARLDRLAPLVEALSIHEVASAVYVGYDNGDFLLLRPWSERLAAARQEMPVPPGTAWLVQAITHDGDGGPVGSWHLFDDAMRPLSNRVIEEYRFDPRERPWYRRAGTREATLSAPYLFFTTREVGVTMSLRAPSGGAVLGMDAALTDLGDEMEALKPSPGTELMIVSDTGEVLAYPDAARLMVETGQGLRLAEFGELGVPALLGSDAWAAGEVQAYRAGDEKWFGLRLPFSVIGDRTAWLLVALPAREVLAEPRRLLRRQVMVAAGLVLLLLPVGLWLGRRIGQPLHALDTQVWALGRFDFASWRGVDSSIVEVRRLSRTLTAMVAGVADFRDIMDTLSSEPRLEAMLQRVLERLLHITVSAEGAIYLVDEDDAGRLLRVALAGEPHEGEPLPETLAVPDDDGGIEALYRGWRDERRHAVPLRDREGLLLGLLILSQWRPRQGGDMRHWEAFVGEVSKAAAVAIEMRRLLAAEERLLDSLVRMMAAAIDAKSPHTGGHCTRVPVLAEMIYQRVAESGEGAFAGVAPSERQRMAFRLGAWLHDCGKLTTPDAVMEKATKLETRYDRIHEIRTRFEVLWRDADIAYWRGRAEGGDEARLARERRARHEELQEAFRHVAAANVGSERMSESLRERLETIAEWRWWRHFDDRQGVSAEEAERMAREPETALPVEEPLLADRPRHCIAWPAGRRPAVHRDDPDNRWGFDMVVPESAGHQGELYNLMIRRGTLNDVERFRMQEHIVQTIMMLEALPWPSALKQVPRIAAHHHERMDGRGYPRRLPMAEASVEERVLALADVFEALTAADRPYKPGLPLSRAFTILAEMVRDGHLDGELFVLLLESGVWRDYAERYLEPWQIDEVDPPALYRLAEVASPG